MSPDDSEHQRNRNTAKCCTATAIHSPAIARLPSAKKNALSASASLVTAGAERPRMRTRPRLSSTMRGVCLPPAPPLPPPAVAPPVAGDASGASPLPRLVLRLSAPFVGDGGGPPDDDEPRESAAAAAAPPPTGTYAVPPMAAATAAAAAAPDAADEGATLCMPVSASSCSSLRRRSMMASW